MKSTDYYNGNDLPSERIRRELYDTEDKAEKAEFERVQEVKKSNSLIRPERYKEFIEDLKTEYWNPNYPTIAFELMISRYELIVDSYDEPGSYIGMILDNIENDMKGFDAVYQAGKRFYEQSN